MMIEKIGGKTVNTFVNSTHIIVSSDNLEMIKKRKISIESQYCINIIWLFHSFLFYKRMPEDDKEYKVILK